MPTPNLLFAFLVTIGLLELTPGPTSAYLLLLTGARGRTAGLYAVAGVTAGLAIYLAASVLGLTALIVTWPPALQLLKVLGVGYLLILAVETWRDPARPVDISALHGLSASVIGVVWRGMLASLLNPKTAVFYLSLLPEFVRPSSGSTAGQLVVLGLIHLAVAIVVHSGIVLAADKAARRLPSQFRAGRRLNRTAAVGIGLVAIWLALQAIRG